jgi:hypothetical protein
MRTSGGFGAWFRQFVSSAKRRRKGTQEAQKAQKFLAPPVLLVFLFPLTGRSMALLMGQVKEQRM